MDVVFLFFLYFMLENLILNILSKKIKNFDFFWEFFRTQFKDLLKLNEESGFVANLKLKVSLDQNF